MNNDYRYSTIMGIFAHPDDETFGPGASFAKYAFQGHKIVVLTATRGHLGKAAGVKIKDDLAAEREQELKNAAKILGINKSIILDFVDGVLNEHCLPILKNLITKSVLKYNPQVIIVYEPGGISMHLDHIAVTKSVLQLYDEGKINPKKIYGYGYPRELMQQYAYDVGLSDEKIATINIKKYYSLKQKAVKAHKTQLEGWYKIQKRFKELPAKWGIGKFETFQLLRTSLKKLKFPEKDLLAGV